MGLSAEELIHGGGVYMRVKICNETTDVIRQNGKIFLKK